ncbi:hypothetical protein V8E53_011058 [Lactarius tabidus]
MAMRQMYLLRSPWALGLSSWFQPHVTSTIPDHWVSKRFLNWRFTGDYRDAMWMTNSPHFPGWHSYLANLRNSKKTNPTCWHPPHPLLQAPIVATIQVDIDESLLKQNKKRISRQQSGFITVGSGNSSSGSTGSSTKSCTTSPPPQAPSPAFGSPLRHDAGLAEEEEDYGAVHGHRRVDVDEDIELERASSRGKKKRTLAQAQAEEAPAPAEGDREHEKRRIREDFEVTAQRLQDVTNAFGTTRASLPPLDTNVFGICLPANPRTRPPTIADGHGLGHAFVRTHIQLDPTGVVDTWHYAGIIAPPYTAPLESASNTSARRGRCRGVDNGPGTACAEDAEPKLNTKMRKPDPVPTQMKRASSGGSQDDDIPMVTERRRKSRPLRLPIDDDDESDGAQADEEPLAGSRVRTGLTNVDTRRRSAVVSASRRSLIEDDEGRRHSMLV